MKRSFITLAVLISALVLTAASTAAAQFGMQGQGQIPRDGACFYQDSNFRGGYFCLRAGEDSSQLPFGFNDKISSIRTFGRASVQVFEDSNFRGPNERFDRSVNELRDFRKRDDPSRTWADRISSIRVESVRFGGGWVNRPQPNVGACFFADGGYSGNYFCLQPGENVRDMPPGFNDRITSIRLMGPVSVRVFENSNFSGPSDIFDRSIGDLRGVRKRDDPSRTWSDRISSIQVESLRGGGRRYPDRDYDYDRDDRYGRNEDYGRRGPRWGRGALPNQGACFYRDRNFSGDYFCVRRGDSMSSLPSGFNDEISSVRLFGGAQVMIFQDSNFRGPNARLNRDVYDLRDRRSRRMSGDWHDRVSSLRVY